MFITLEGADASGKSTQVNLLADALRARGTRVVITREPGGTPMGEAVRGILLGRHEMSPIAEALLFAAARAQHVAQVIRPALAEGAWVVCDRFIDSSLAYQGVARDLGVERVLAINEPALDGLMPDLTLVLDVPPSVTEERMSGPGDRIESEGPEFQRTVASAYRDLHMRFPERISLIPDMGTPEQVHASVMAAVAILGV